MPGKHKIVKARKDHSCYYCRRIIPKGSDYVLYQGLGLDRRWEQYKMHIGCEEKYWAGVFRTDDHLYLAELCFGTGE